jgi:hypothetical protein
MSHDPTDGREVTVRCLENPEVSVRLYDRRLPDEYGVAEFSVELQADGLRACFGPVDVWVWDAGGLPGFVSRLADDFGGWVGRRTWSTNHLTIDADHHSRGRVRLRWTLRPWITRDDGWSATVTTWVEAGAQMSRLADDLHPLLPDLGARRLR